MKITLPNLTTGWPLLISLVLLPTVTRAERPLQLWARSYGGEPEGCCPIATAVAVDGSNNVIVAGFAARNLPIRSQDYAIVKYSGDGVPLWTNRYGEVGPLGYGYRNHPVAMAVDSSDNVILTGTSLELTNFFGEGGTNLAYLTIKISSNGTLLWADRWNGPRFNDAASAIAVDRGNNVIVTGTSENANYNTDCLTIKYSSDGARLWISHYDGPGNRNDAARAIAVDASNDVIVTGSSDIRTSPGPDQLAYLTIKYSSEGVPLWTNIYKGLANDFAVAVAVDGSNSVIVTGYTVIKYSSEGVPLWTNIYNGGSALVVDGSNSVIVTSGIKTVKYSNAGVALWTNLCADIQYAAVAVDGKGNVIVTGDHSYSARTIIKYSGAGLPLWTNICNDLQTDFMSRVSPMAMDGSNNVIVAGYYQNRNPTNYFSDFLTVKYTSVPSPPVITWVGWNNGAFQMQVNDEIEAGTLVIEASANLFDWSPVFTNATPTNVVYYTAPDAGYYAWRFYRALQRP